MHEHDTLTHLGVTYTYRAGKWVDDRYMIACESVQQLLNKKYYSSVDTTTMSIETLVADADKLKEGTSYDLAITMYEQASKTADQKTLAYILPRLTSCYRKANRPDKAIVLLTFANHKYGPSMLTPTLLTSAAAAYCDMDEYDKALACCKRAQAKMQGAVTSELKMVYNRIWSEYRRRHK